jgi:hypothetical protein
MGGRTIREVVVWLDESAPDSGAFRHALDWASRLEVSLRGVLADEQHRRLATDWRSEATGKEASGLLAACEAACRYASVPWQQSVCHGPVTANVGWFLQPTALAVVGSTLAEGAKDALLGQATHGPAFPVLVCPQTWQPLERVLVLHQDGPAVATFLDAMAELCGTLRLTPVVLTVARRERAALTGQRTAQAIWSAHGYPADFDMLVGCKVQTAVASVARWRRCSHVFVERRHSSPWWAWLRADSLGQLLALSDSFPFLVFPSEKTADSAPEAALTLRSTS